MVSLWCHCGIRSVSINAEVLDEGNVLATKTTVVWNICVGVAVGLSISTPPVIYIIVYDERWLEMGMGSLCWWTNVLKGMLRVYDRIWIGDTNQWYDFWISMISQSAPPHIATPATSPLAFLILSRSKVTSLLQDVYLGERYAGAEEALLYRKQLIIWCVHLDTDEWWAGGRGVGGTWWHTMRLYADDMILPYMMYEVNTTFLNILKQHQIRWSLKEISVYHYSFHSIVMNFVLSTFFMWPFFLCIFFFVFCDLTFTRCPVEDFPPCHVLFERWTLSGPRIRSPYTLEKSPYLLNKSTSSLPYLSLNRIYLN